MSTPAQSGGGNVPATPSTQFKAARDGKVSETERPDPVPEQIQKAANDVVAESSKDKTCETTLASKKGRLSYNVNAHGLTTTKSTQVQPPEAIRPYTSKENGTTFKTKAAIEAAKNLDQVAQNKREDEKKQIATKKVTKHYAPAPRPKGMPATKYRGRSTSTTLQAAEQTGATKDHQQLSAYQARVIAAAQKNHAQEQGNSKSQEQNKDQSMGR
jgi:hypothetical protein